MAKMPNGRLSLLQYFRGSSFGHSICKCIAYPSRQLIRVRVTMIALAIKAKFLVHWCAILFAGLRGIIHWLWLRGLPPIFNGEEMGAGGHYLWRCPTYFHLSCLLDMAPHPGVGDPCWIKLGTNLRYLSHQKHGIPSRRVMSPLLLLHLPRNPLPCLHLFSRGRV
jgi:hypothetical protein